jgi:hypothetical protein
VRNAYASRTDHVRSLIVLLRARCFLTIAFHIGFSIGSISSLTVCAITFYINFTLVRSILASALSISRATTFYALRIARAPSLYTLSSLLHSLVVPL